MSPSAPASKILLVVSRWPWPPRRGDRLRAVQVAGFLAAEHEVTLLAPAREPAERDEAAPAGLPFRVETYRRSWWARVPGALRALAGRLPWQSALFYQPDLGRRLRELAPAADLVVLQLVRLAPHLADLGATPLAVDLIDCLSLNLAGRARYDHPVLRWALNAEARRVARCERRLIARSSLDLVVCERDREALAAGLSAEEAERLAVVPIAVAPPATELAAAEPAAAAEPLLVFTGNLGYFPNADGIVGWLETTWPALAPLRNRHPGLRLVVAGDRPGRRVRRAVAAAGVQVRLEASPADLAPLLAGATVALAPLRCGSGVPIKVLEAWGAGVPVIASPFAAAGAAARAGEDLLVAVSAEEWRVALSALLDEPGGAAERRRLAAAGRARLAADHAPEVVGERLRVRLRAVG
jgi:glycosyltransferase involved in cell wall biosynthesis